MNFKPAQCPNCAGALQLPDDRNTVNCMYCGITIVVREAIQAAAIGQAKNWLKIAGTAAQSGNHQEAYEFYTRILEVDADNSEAWLGRAEAAGRLSTVTNSRLMEMITGIKKALDSAPNEQRGDIEKRSVRIVCSVVPSYYNSMRAQITPHLFDVASRVEYINQIQKVMQALETAHLEFPKNVEILNSCVQLCRENLDRLAFRNPRTGQFNYWHLPPDQKLWLQGRSAYYNRELSAMNPQRTLNLESKSGLAGLIENSGLTESIEWFKKLGKPGMIALAAGVGLIGLLFLAVLVQDSKRVNEGRTPTNALPSRPPSTNSNSQPSLSVPSPVDSASLLKRGQGLLSGSPAKEAIVQAKESLSQIPASAREYNEAQRLLGTIPGRLKQVEIPALREALRKEYEEMLTEANPHLNSINTKIVKNGKSLTLYGVHTYFSQYSFKIGSLGPSVSEWIATNRTRLEEAGISRVGVMGEGDFASWAWFEL